MSTTAVGTMSRCLRSRNNICGLLLSKVSEQNAVFLIDRLHRSNKTCLRTLDNSAYSSCTSIGKRGAESARRMLEQNDTITSLDLYSEIFCDECVMTICRGLEQNSTVSKFGLRSRMAWGSAAIAALSRLICVSVAGGNT